MSTLLAGVRKQRKAAFLAIGLSIAAIWIAATLSDWQFGVFMAVGMLLGFANHVATEVTMQRAIDGGDQLTKTQVGGKALARLLVVGAVAVAIAWAFWPYGATVLFGLAIFHMIALVMTWGPLLRELNKA